LFGSWEFRGVALWLCGAVLAAPLALVAFGATPAHTPQQAVSNDRIEAFVGGSLRPGLNDQEPEENPFPAAAAFRPFDNGSDHDGLIAQIASVGPSVVPRDALPSDLGRRRGVGPSHAPRDGLATGPPRI
jgi:hypothetical protein